MRNYLETALKSGVKLLHLSTDELEGLLDELAAKDAELQEYRNAEPVALVEQSDFITTTQIVGEEPRTKAVRELYKGALVIGAKLFAAPQTLDNAERAEPQEYRNAARNLPDVIDAVVNEVLAVDTIASTAAVKAMFNQKTGLMRLDLAAGDELQEYRKAPDLKSGDGLENLLWYAREASCHPDPNYACEYSNLAAPGVVASFLEELLRYRSAEAATFFTSATQQWEAGKAR